ncbi:polynucleotide adenylyltransferase PcnB [Salinisphaera hydrothermalis]|uniref:polynucleotide adenylyltransferase PcnB n=1 Tax=Salinisphaera hydrothermalis TaxID=563188 RepID=UPI0033400E37
MVEPKEHGITRDDISDAALAVLDGLHDAGYRACLVGGAVRDLLLGVTPKDFDVATDAEPEAVVDVFGRKARLIGRRFQICHVRFGREIVEVSTFRADPANGDTEDTRELDDAGRVLRDNVFGSIAEDARRRDFAINGLYLDVADHCIYDYVDGLSDIEARRLRLIGDARVRYREDPVRMIRAVRIAAKLDLALDPEAEPPADMIELLADVPAARMFDEVLKLLMHPAGPQVYRMLRHYDLLRPLFEDTMAVLDSPTGAASEALIEKAIANTAARMEANKPVTPAFIFAALLWPAVREGAANLEREGMPPAPALASAQSQVVSRQVQRVAIPKRFSIPMREIWQLQPRFHKRRGRHPERLIPHPRFRAAYDFLLLRAQVGEVEPELAEWWTVMQDDPSTPKPASGAGSRRRKRRGGRARKTATADS